MAITLKVQETKPTVLKIPNDGQAKFQVTDLVKVVSGGGSLQDKSVTPTDETQVVRADFGYDGLNTVTVDPIPSNYGLITWDGTTLTIS